MNQQLRDNWLAHRFHVLLATALLSFASASTTIRRRCALPALLVAGERFRQSKLGGSELEFDDPDTCMSLIEKVHPTASDHFTVVLTCRRVGPPEDLLAAAVAGLPVRL
jgi:hypothetical protein